jgi:DNA-directed RNA polymerase I, II, and III subunit RPABC2
MDMDEVIESGMDGDEFFDEEYDEELNENEEQQEGGNNDVKPELKKLYQQHPECVLDYIESVVPKIPLQVIPPGGDNADSNHRTYPFITLYEKTKIIGLRSNQLSKGAKPFINVPPHITDVRDIARLELEQKRLPFIIKRPLPDGSYEYWRISDLIIL